MNGKLQARLMKFAPEMRDAMTAHTEGIVRVIAGAGTGKTTVLQNRMIYLYETGRAKNSEILCVSFTNKAVQEIKDRIPRGIGNRPLYNPFVATFHSFSAYYLHRGNMACFNFPDDFNIAGDIEHEAISEIIAKDLNLSEKELSWGELVLMIEKRKMNNYREYVLLLKDSSGKQILEKQAQATTLEEAVFYRYLFLQRKNNLLDFSDLLCFLLVLLEDDPIFREELQEQYQYILVDEFQDISPIEFAIMRIVAEKHGNFFCVGDPDQCIYSFRGSNIQFLTQLETYFPNHQVHTIVLTENHRSSGNILTVGNTIIEKNKNRYPKRLFTKKSNGLLVFATLQKNHPDEARWIANEICQRITILNAQSKFGRTRKAERYGNIAVLVRNTWLIQQLKSTFSEFKIPYSDGTFPLLQRKCVKDLIAYLKFIVFHDDLSFKRIINTPPRGIGFSRWGKIAQTAHFRGIRYYEALNYLSETDTDFQTPEVKEYFEVTDDLYRNFKEQYPAFLFREILDRTGYGEYAEREDPQNRMYLECFLKSVEKWRFAPVNPALTFPVAEFMNDLALKPEKIFGEHKEDTVKLLTVHRSKGLEFETVYLAGLNQKIFPSSKALTQDEKEEERRLMYVACTRAKSALILSAFLKRTCFYEPSEYLSDLKACPAVVFSNLFNDSITEKVEEREFKDAVN